MPHISHKPNKHQLADQIECQRKSLVYVLGVEELLAKRVKQEQTRKCRERVDDSMQIGMRQPALMVVAVGSTRYAYSIDRSVIRSGRKDLGLFPTDGIDWPHIAPTNLVAELYPMFSAPINTVC